MGHRRPLSPRGFPLSTPGIRLASVNHTLDPGWNLVGYLASSNQTVAVALGGITYTGVAGFAAGSDYSLRDYLPADMMGIDSAYWIRVDTAQVWST